MYLEQTHLMDESSKYFQGYSMPCASVGKWKRHHFIRKVYIGLSFLSKWYILGKGLDLGAEPSFPLAPIRVGHYHWATGDS